MQDDSSPSESTPKKKILVVEDNPEIRTLNKIWLTDKGGYSVHAATDGQEGLAAAMQDAYDLIITDLKMPVMNGLAMSQLLRQSGNQTRVLFYSSSLSNPLFEPHLKDIANSSTLWKPQSAVKLLAVVDSLLGVSRVV